MQPIVVPTINSNDTDAVLQAWCKADGDQVRAGETLAILETTKASFDLAAETDGVLGISATAGERYLYGASLGWVFADRAEKERFLAEHAAAATGSASADQPVVTRAARELAAKYGIAEARLAALGKRVIREADVEALVDGGIRSAECGTAQLPVARNDSADASATSVPLSPQQQGIARVVAHSRSTIPEAFLLKKVLVDNALAALGEFSQTQKTMTGLPDLLVWIVAKLAPEFPFFFGALRDDLTFAGSVAGNVGVTFDVGHGLFIPVIRDAASLSLKEVAKRMMQFRMRAARNSFKTEELTGGDISLSINMDADILCVIPVILKPQTCMVSLSAVLSEVALDAGQPVTRRYVQLGAAYDHRAINGYHANAFLNSIKAGLENPEAAEWQR